MLLGRKWPRMFSESGEKPKHDQECQGRTLRDPQHHTLGPYNFQPALLNMATSGTRVPIALLGAINKTKNQI